MKLWRIPVLICLGFLLFLPVRSDSTGTSVSDLTALSATPASGDLFMCVDVSDTSMASSGTNKKITYSYLMSGNATTATALAANGANCVDGQAALGVDASGAGECVSLGAAALAAEDFGDFTCTGSASGCTVDANSIALTTDTTGNYVASITNGTGITGGDGGSEGAALTIAASLGTSIAPSEMSDSDFGDFTCATGSCTVDADAIALGTDTTGNYAGSSSEGGAATTATALAADPSDCAANQFANAIATSGNLTCAAIGDADVPDDITVSIVKDTSPELGGDLETNNHDILLDTATDMIRVATTTAGHYFSVGGYTGAAWIDVLQVVNAAVPEVELQSGATLSGLGPMALKNADTSGAYLDLYEDSDNGTHYARIIAEDNITSNGTVTIGDEINAGALPFVTTGAVSGAISIVADNNGRSIATSEAYGTLHVATGTGTWVLPDVCDTATGANICLLSTTAVDVIIDLPVEDAFTYEGTTESDGESLDSDDGAGEYICVVCAVADEWYVFGHSAGWTGE